MVLSQKQLETLKKKVKYGTESTLPFSQGWVINEMIKRYNIPAKKWGYYHDIISIETNRQYLFWKDLGGRIDFLGVLDKVKTKKKVKK